MQSSGVQRPGMSRTLSAQSATSLRSSHSHQPRPPTHSVTGPNADPGAAIIDMEIFKQILELDDDDESCEFSRATVSEYFVQVDETFGNMDKALSARDLESMSQLGHFLKGSSAALGVRKVKASCEQMQNIGHLRDEDNDVNLTEEQALQMLDHILKRVKVEHREAKGWLERYFA